VCLGVIREGAYDGTLLADPLKGIEMIKEDSKVYENALKEEEAPIDCGARSGQRVGDRVLDSRVD
jgi:hypothetical protein